MKDIDPKKVHLYSIKDRVHKVQINQFSHLPKNVHNFSEWFNNLPDILAAGDFKAVVKAIVYAYEHKKPVIVMIGGHIIKCGVTPLLIDLMKRGIITGVVMNGSASIHDTEVAMIGQTSEDVAKSLEDGTFGMVHETGDFIHAALKFGCSKGWGMGYSIGKSIQSKKLPNRSLSVLANGVQLGLPITVHTAIGTDTIYQHPAVDGAVMGTTSLKDFHLFVEQISNLDDGGVLLNLGSAVILPEVFLKALTIARNLGYPVRNFVTCNFDMIQHYRPRENVVSRPTRTGGKGYAITGHHELMIPLLYSSVMAILEKKTTRSKKP